VLGVASGRIHEAVALQHPTDVAAVLLVADEVPDLVALLEDLPGDVPT